MENKDIKIKGKGISIRILSIIFMVIGVIIMISSFFVIRHIYQKYDEMRDSYQSLDVEKNAADDFKKASDYLTEQTLRFVATGEPMYVSNYFEEKDELKNRERSIQLVGNDQILSLEKGLLEDAMEQSEALVIYELHAMKLVATAKEIDASQLPAELAGYELTAEEKAMDAASKREKASAIVYSTDYETMKSKINWDVEQATVLVEEELGSEYHENENSLILTLNIATLLIFLMFVLLVLIFIFTSLLVVKPANRFVEALNHHEKLPEIGGYEFRKFARRYNDVYRSDKKDKAMLMEQGEIDELTGTFKAGMLDIIKGHLTEESLGILMVDIDNFRSIKEANGYEAAEDGIPAASVSVGAAFSDSGFNTEVERKADMALNYVKENGRGSCKISD